MSELTLKDLISLEEPAVKQKSFRVVRHIMKGHGWEGFDDMIRFDDELLNVFAGNMGSDRYKGAEIILTCVALPRSKALLRAAFRNHGIISFTQARKHYTGYDRYNHYLRSNNIHTVKDLSKQIFYKLERIPLLEEFRNRLVIDWGKNSQTYIQKRLDKPVSEIYPKGFVSFFPGWDRVKISYRELKEIIDNPDGNKDWFQYLSSHSGVYVILDEKSGKQYVGSAYGGEGLWTRWSGYARTGHNGNKALKALASKDPNFADKFTFSLHHVFPKTVSKNEVIEFESMLKLKLGSRAFGLNEN